MDLGQGWLVRRTMAQTVFVDGLAVFLLISAGFHLLLPGQTTRWMGQTRNVRVVGALLLVLAAVCLRWEGWYFWTLAAGLAVSGVLRLIFAARSIRLMENSYPRWVHGCIMVGGAVLVWVLRP